MKAICTETYYDEQLHRTVGKGDELELTDKRFAELSGEKNKAKKALVRKKEDKMAQNEKVERYIKNGASFSEDGA